MPTWDGFYASYMSGSEGQGFAMFVFRDGVIVGTDPFGVKFDGSYKLTDDNSLSGSITVKVPPGGTVIQGASAGPNGLTYIIPIKFGDGDFDLDFLSVNTPLGPVNFRMKRLRAFEAET